MSESGTTRLVVSLAAVPDAVELDDARASDLPVTLLELGKAVALSGDAVSAEKCVGRLLELEVSSPPAMRIAK